MLKKLISTAILSSVIGSVSANPELGYMTLNTDQHYFFNATIAIDALPAELADKKLKVKLGSITDFYRHDIEYDKRVASLRFQVTKDANGKPIIRVRSIREITAEQLQAVVKLYVGRQKVYGIYDFQLTPNKKEHHVSLNLLNSDHKPEEKQRYAKNTKSNTTQSSEAIASSVTTSRKVAKRVEISSDLQYQVMPGNTISQIAMALLPEYPEISSRQALMEQLVSINPDAFINGDINQLKSDAVLNLPARGDSHQITSLDTGTGNTGRTVEAELVIEESATETSRNKIEQPGQNYAPGTRAKAPVNEPLAQSSVEAKTSLAAVENDGEGLNKEQKSEDIGERKSYLVSRGETLSLIAIKLYPDYPEQESWTGLMDELVALNPDAFIDGDINQLWAETELTLPTRIQPNHEVAETPKNTTDEAFPHLDSASGLIESDNDIYQVSSGETISAIAIKLEPEYPEAGQWQAVMGRLVALNPEAFIDGDINRLLSNALLILPERDDFEVVAENQYQVSEGDSISVIAMKLLPNYPKNQDWKVVMNSLIRLNPNAFIGGNESRLRADTVLTIPGQVELEIEAENQEFPDTQLPDSSFNNLEEARETNLAPATLSDDPQYQPQKKK